MKRDGYVLLPQPIQQEAVRLLEESELKVMAAPEANPESVAPLMRDARAVVLRTGIRMTAELINRSDDLLTVSRTGAGFDNVDVKAATEKGVIVTSSIGVNTSSVAEHCLTILLCLFKQLFLLDREVRNGNFQIRYKNYSRDLEGKTLGIIGCGNIGSLVLKKMSGFGMKILVCDPYLSEERYKELGIEHIPFDDVIKESDIITIHVPLTDETRGMFHLEKFRLMKKAAVIINTARGPVLSTDDLITALKTGIISGAGIDVYETEPPAPDSEIITMDNVILSPHIAWSSEEGGWDIRYMIMDDVKSFLEGKPPRFVVNPEVLESSKLRFKIGN